MADGFKKIDLDTSRVAVSENTSKNPVFSPAPMIKQSQPMTRRRRFNFKNLTRRQKIIVGVVCAFLLFVLFAIAIPAKRTYSSALKTYTQAKLVAAAIKQQNIELAADELDKTEVALEETQKNLNSLVVLRFIPIAHWYYNDADHMLKAGVYGLESAKVVVDSLEPYADVLGLKGQGSFVGGSADERIKTAVLTMGKITPKIDNITKSLKLMQEEIDQVNPKHYPKLLFGEKVATQLTQVRDLTNQSVAFVDEARPLIKVLPSLLGESEEKRYLVLFQNDKELRSTGGFITAYSIFKLDKGVITVERSDDIYPLDDTVPNKPKAPQALQRYLKVSRFNLRDANISPDFVESMKTFKEMYDTAGASVEVDGIIALDTHVLVSTIKILDDQVSANGITFTTKTDERCDCPQVIYELEDEISRPVNYVKTDRKNLIGALMNSIMSKALSSSPKLYWGPLFQSMLMQVNQKHIMFYLSDKDAQEGVEALNAAGRIKPFEGDYLHINDTNFAGAKANLFVKQSVENAYEVAKDGTITKTLTIKYNNPYKPSNCSLLSGGLCLNAELRDWHRVYVP
ncbi:MAG TPA: DUF4012 domain-containing protein, partial [Patescibacteria group bacterium]|nr:DUF4012 domain-containing protein [Patescibacteria group bacterium]